MFFAKTNDYFDTIRPHIFNLDKLPEKYDNEVFSKIKCFRKYSRFSPLAFHNTIINELKKIDVDDFYSFETFSSLELVKNIYDLMDAYIVKYVIYTDDGSIKKLFSSIIAINSENQKNKYVVVRFLFYLVFYYIKFEKCTSKTFVEVVNQKIIDTKNSFNLTKFFLGTELNVYLSMFKRFLENDYKFDMYENEYTHNFDMRVLNFDIDQSIEIDV